MLAPILAFLTSKAGIVAIVCALVLGVIATQTLRLNHAKADLTSLKAANKAAAAQVAALNVKSAAISEHVASDVSAERTRVRTITKTLIERVPEYVPADADRDCVVPRGWVRLHDAAAAGVSAPAGGPEPAASGVALSAVAQTVIANYGIAYDWRAEALGWRDWYKAQAAAWNGK